MKIKLLFLFVALSINVSLSHAQDLIHKVPADASMVFTFNNKAFFEKVGVKSLNETLSKFGMFDKLIEKNATKDITGVEDFGIDIHSKAYTYVKLLDSVNFVGALIPLANKAQFESLIPKDEKIEIVNNLSTVYSKDKTLRMSWDNHTVYVLSAIETFSFFSREDVKERYGLLSRYDEQYGTSDDELVTIADSAVAVEYYDEELDTTEVWIAEVEEVEDFEDEYDMVDSILAQDEYQDDYYSRYDSIYHHNDSIENALLATWLNIEFEKVVNGNNGNYYSKRVKSLSNNTLVHLYSDNIRSFTNTLYGLYGMNGGLGYYNTFSPYSLLGMRTDGLNFGVENFEGQIDVVDNKIKFVSSIGVNNELAKKYKEIYKKGVNPKFYNFLDKDVLAFMTVNMNTEAYLKHTPSMLNDFYGPLFPKYSEAIGLATDVFEVLLDEKAIGKVFKGDNLFVLNGVTKATVTYSDYEYDDDYNYVEVEKTKTETIPQFLWMFSSEDTKIFERLIQIGIKENELNDMGGFYGLSKKSRTGIDVYVQIKNGIVFIGNDLDKMNAIKSNVQGKSYSPYVGIAKKNVLSFVFNTKRVPVLLNEFEIPVDRGFKSFVDELNQYGDFTITSPGMVGNSFKSEAVIEFPKNKANALQYLLDLVDRNIN